MSAIAERTYALRRALALVARQPGRFVLAAVLSAAALALSLLVAVLAVAAVPAWKAVRAGPELSVFVKLGMPPGELQMLRGRLAALDGVHTVRVIPREQAFGELSKRLGLGATSSDARSNPLPDALVARFALTVDPEVVDRAAAASRQWPGVDVVQSDIDWYRRLVAARQLATPVITGLAGTLGLLLIAALIATAQLPVCVSTAEAEVLRLVGAQPSFARRPYAYAGALALATGATVALAMTWATLSWIAPRLGPLAQHLDLATGPPSVLAWLGPAVVLTAAFGGGVVAGLAARRQIGRLNTM